MAKKIETSVDKVTNSTSADVKVSFNKKIDPLMLDLGRADLNQLVDKLNEVIEKVNK